MNHTRPQQDPEPGKDSVTDAVMLDLQSRREMGQKKYGTELKTHNGRAPLVDAYQEALDLALYLKQGLMEQKRPPTREELEQVCMIALSPWVGDDDRRRKAKACANAVFSVLTQSAG